MRREETNGQKTVIRPLIDVRRRRTLAREEVAAIGPAARLHRAALRWPGGEAEVSRNAFRKMPKAEREAMVRYLRAI
ncbi:MAG: di-heme oxidoredictase family protein [Pseudomonadota bacterium]